MAVTRLPRLPATQLEIAGLPHLLLSASPIQCLSSAPSANRIRFPNQMCAPGVVRCVGFDKASDIAVHHGVRTTGIDTNWHHYVCQCSIRAIKACGNSSLKFTIPSQFGRELASGAYWTNFSDDLLTQFGENNDFYVQWRQRFSPEFLNTIYLKSAGECWRLETNRHDHGGYRPPAD